MKKQTKWFSVLFLALLLPSMVSFMVPSAVAPPQEPNPDPISRMKDSIVTSTPAINEDFWFLFKAYAEWDLEWFNGASWVSRKSALQIVRDYPNASRCKITMIFTSVEAGDYRLTFLVSRAVKRYVNKTSNWQYELHYEDVTLVFDWSDMKDIGGLQFSHGILDGDFWFRVRRNNIPASYYIELDPSVVATTTANTATSFGSFQPKVFKLVGRYWAIYGHIANGFRYKTSTDGVTWGGELVIVDPPMGIAGSGIAFWWEEDQGFLHYVRSHGADDLNHIYYRRGAPQSDGTITWSQAEQTYTGNHANNEYYYPSIAVDTNRYVWVGYRNVSAGGPNEYVNFIRSEQTDGTFVADEVLHLNLTSIADGWIGYVIPLTAGKVYAFLLGNGTQRGGRLWDGATWGSFEWIGPWSDNPINQPRVPTGGISTVADGDNLYTAFSWHNTSAVPWVNQWGFTYRTYSVGSWSDTAYYDSDVYETTTPATIQAVDSENFLIWFQADGDLYYRRFYNGVMDSQRTLGLDADITLTYTSSLNG